MVQTSLNVTEPSLWGQHLAGNTPGMISAEWLFLFSPQVPVYDETILKAVCSASPRKQNVPLSLSRCAPSYRAPDQQCLWRLWVSPVNRSVSSTLVERCHMPCLKTHEFQENTQIYVRNETMSHSK